MSIGEFTVRLLASLKPLLAGVIVTVAATVTVMLCLYFSGRNAWLKSRKFPLPSLFFGLSGFGTFRIACAWIRLVFPIVYIISFQKLVIIQYLMILLPGLILVCSAGSPGKALSAILNLLLELAGILSASLICGYITEMRAGTGFLLVYAAIGVFLVLFVVYLFLQDLEHISAGRSVNPHEIWRTPGDGEI